MPHWRTMMDSDSEFVGAWDLPRDATVEIAAVRAVALPDRPGIKGGRKPVLTFRNASKKLIVGATIGNAIASMYGSEVTAWVGKRITLYATTTKSKGGSVVDCVRVRPVIPRGPATGIDAQPVDHAMRDRQRRGAGELPPEGDAATGTGATGGEERKAGA